MMTPILKSPREVERIEWCDAMRRFYIYGLLGLITGLGLVLAGKQFLQPSYRFHGAIITPPFQAPEISLNDQNGRPYLLTDHKGQVVLVFFGYSNCADICPTTLATLKQARQSLGGRSSDVQVVFVTVDPMRDTAEKLKSYLAGFDPSFIGLTGSIEQLQPVWKAYGVYAQAQAVSQGNGELVEHSSQVYVIDPHGNLRLTFPYGTTMSEMADDIRYLLDGR